LFADDTSILFAHHDIQDLNMNRNMNNTFQIVNKWFKSNLLSLNYEKTQCTQFRTNFFKLLIRTKNSMQNDNRITYGNNIISDVPHIKFLGLILDSTWSWSKRIE
jgi:hypothetical protein